ncbi:hypothetical protein [uncultured Jannaschia sp.]|uniref:hypothetical protein n=1 Tax=uncultured Jannaschia sp. TaxID=293347 RepID=UPI002621C60B|nr:hypothetical protein [uncultured Jannaschia sp.]
MPNPIPEALFDRRPVPGFDRVFWRLDPPQPGIRPPDMRTFLDDPANQSGLWLFTDGHPNTPLRFRWVDGWGHGGLHGRLFDPPDRDHPPPETG